MRKILRLLCALVDGVIVMFACQIVLFGLFGVPLDGSFTAQTFFMLVYCVYNGLFLRYMHGQTPGKAIGRLVVVELPLEENLANLQKGQRGRNWQKISLHVLFLRESCKAMYFFPLVGWIAGLVAIGMILFGREPLHDRLSQTVVVFVGGISKIGKNDK